jgi:hypothetical protein
MMNLQSPEKGHNSMEDESERDEVLRELLRERDEGPFITSREMDDLVERMIEQKREQYGLRR